MGTASALAAECRRARDLPSDHPPPGSVIAPALADETSAAYFASVPISLGGLSAHLDLLAARSSSLRSTVSSRFSASMAIRSPFSNSPIVPRLRPRGRHDRRRGRSCAGELAVGDEAGALAETLADDGGGGREHLPHARAFLRALVAYDHGVAGGDIVRRDGSEGLLLEVADLGGPSVFTDAEARDLGDASFLGEVSLQDREMSLAVERRVKSAG